MVTAETTKEVLFTLDNCLLCKFVELVTKYLPLPPKIIKLKKPNKALLQYSPTKTLPILKTGDDFITGALPIVKYLVKTVRDDSDGVTPDMKKILLGKTLKEESKVDTWLNYISNSVYPEVVEIYKELYGKKKFEQNIFDTAVNDLLENLQSVNEELKLKPFLTSNNIQLGDLMLASALFHFYNDVLTKDKLEKIPNVVRVFKFVANMKEFKTVFGNAVECKAQKTPEPFVEEKHEQHENKEEEGHGKKNKKDKKHHEQNKNEQEKKENENEEKKEEAKKEEATNEESKKEEGGEEGGKKKKHKKNKNK